jgi:outer membrane biosynthesis protein TonB
MRMKTASILALAAIAAAAMAAGCSSAKKDEALATDIQAKMFADPQVKAANLAVTVKDGEATLTGTVRDDGAHYQAYKIASDTPGVKHVNDQMSVEAAQAPLAPPPAPVEPAPAVKSERTSKSAKQHAGSKMKPKKVEQEQASAPAPEPAPAPAATPVQQEAAATPPPTPPQPKQMEIPAGTSVRVQMIDAVDSSVNHAGQVFHGSLSSPIVIDDQVVVPAGTDMYVKLTNAKSAGHMTGQSELVLELVRMDFQGKTYSLVSNDYQQTGASRGKRTAETVGGGAAVGALLGALIGHGKGAAIGAAAGAGTGTAVEAATKGQQIQIASETKLDFTLQQPVDVSYFPEKNRSPRR